MIAADTKLKRRLGAKLFDYFDNPQMAIERVGGINDWLMILRRGRGEAVEAEFGLMGTDFAGRAGPEESGFGVEGEVEVAAEGEFGFATGFGALVGAEVAFEFVACDGGVGVAGGGEGGWGGGEVWEVGGGVDGEEVLGGVVPAVGELAGEVGEADLAALDELGVGGEVGGGPCEEIASGVGAEAVEVGEGAGDAEGEGGEGGWDGETMPARGGGEGGEAGGGGGGDACAGGEEVAAGVFGGEGEEDGEDERGGDEEPFRAMAGFGGAPCGEGAEDAEWEDVRGAIEETGEESLK